MKSYSGVFISLEEPLDRRFVLLSPPDKCHHRNTLRLKNLYPHLNKVTASTNLNVSSNHLEQNAQQNVFFSARTFNESFSLEKLNQQLQDIDPCSGCINDLIIQASAYLENKDSEAALLYLVTAFRIHEQIFLLGKARNFLDTKLEEYRIQGLLDQTLKAYTSLERENIFKRYKNVDLMSYMVGLNPSVLTSKEMDNELYSLLRQIYENLQGKELIGMQKTLCEQFYPIMQNRFIDNLKQLYSKNDSIEFLIEGKTLPIKKIYTSLVIIEDQERKQQEKLSSQKLLGKKPQTDEAHFGAKAPIDLKKLFKHEEIARNCNKRLVIYGSAGIGKSTLCHYISHQWATGLLWPQFKAVFWVKFRDLNNTNAKSTYQILIHQCLHKEEEERTDEILLKDPNFRKKCLLILDGYDEFTSNQKMYKTFSGRNSNLLEALKEDFEYILMTTRPPVPHVSGFEEASKIEIIGFDQKGIEQYLENFFEEKDTGKEAFEDQLRNPLVNSLCHIPINLEIFCSLALTGEIFFLEKPLTTTKIYQKLIDHLIIRFRKDKLSQPFDPLTVEAIDVEDFVEGVFEELAWEMIEAGCSEVSEDQMKGVLRRLRGNQSSLVIGIKQIGPLRIDDKKGHFIHPTFQDFFGAKYLVRILLNSKSNFRVKETIKNCKNSRERTFPCRIRDLIKRINSSSPILFLKNLTIFSF